MVTLYKVTTPQDNEVVTRPGQSIYDRAEVLNQNKCHDISKMDFLVRQYIRLSESNSLTLEDIAHEAIVTKLIIDLEIPDEYVISFYQIKGGHKRSTLAGIEEQSLIDLEKRGYVHAEGPTQKLLGIGNKLNPYMFDGSPQGFLSYVKMFDLNFVDNISDYSKPFEHILTKLVDIACEAALKQTEADSCSDILEKANLESEINQKSKHVLARLAKKEYGDVTQKTEGLDEKLRQRKNCYAMLMTTINKYGPKNPNCISFKKRESIIFKEFYEGLASGLNWLRKRLGHF